MLRYVPWQELTDEQITRLEESGMRGGWKKLDIAEAVISGRWRCFSWKDGVLAVSADEGKMTIEACWVRKLGWSMRRLRDVLDRLATDYACHTVETMCFDLRLAQAMLHIRGKHVGWLVRWTVEGTSNG